MTRPGSSLLRNTFFATVSAGSVVLPFVLLLAAGRILGEQDYGKFSFALALATIFETLAGFGLEPVTTRTVARDRSAAPRLVANTVGLKFVLATGAMILLVVAASVLRSEADVRIACYLLGVSAMLRSYLLTARHLMMGLERFEMESVVVIGDRLLLLAAGLAALFLGYGLIGLAIAFVIARVIAVVAAYGLSRAHIGPFMPAFDVAYWKDLQRQALPFGAFAIVLYLYNYVDTVMLGVMRSDAETGFYSAAYRLYEGLVTIPGIINAVLIPRLARQFVHEPDKHRRLARVSFWGSVVIALPIVGLSLLLAGPIVQLAFGEAYLPAVAPFGILAPGLLFVFPLYVLHAEAISSNAEQLLLKAGAGGCLVNVALNAVLIPDYGMNGASVATLLAELMTLVFLLVAVRKSQLARGTMT